MAKERKQILDEIVGDFIHEFSKDYSEQVSKFTGDPLALSGATVGKAMIINGLILIGKPADLDFKDVWETAAQALERMQELIRKKKQQNAERN